MPVSYTYAVFKSPEFQGAIAKINAAPMKSGAVAYRVARLVRGVNQEAKIQAAAWQKLLDTYCEKDKDGKFVNAEGQNNVLKLIPETIAEFHKQTAEFDSTAFDIPVSPIKVDDLDGCKISASDIEALGGFIVPPSEE